MKYIRMLWAEFGYGTVISTTTSVPLLSPGPNHPFGSSRFVRLIPTRYCFHGHGNMPSSARSKWSDRPPGPFLCVLQFFEVTLDLCLGREVSCTYPCCHLACEPVCELANIFQRKVVCKSKYQSRGKGVSSACRICALNIETWYSCYSFFANQYAAIFTAFHGCQWSSILQCTDDVVFVCRTGYF